LDKLSDFQKEVEQLLKERNWFPHDNLTRYYTLSQLMEEVGEVARCVTLIESNRDKVSKPSKDEALENLKLELGDVLWNVLKLASAYNIELDESIRNTINKVKEKYPPKEGFKQH
jgi:NTP pyrophosphatase (non-canonical NTP hydrolase)